MLIYVVEDDEEDQILLRTILETCQLTSQLRFFANGSELFIWLTHQLDGKLPDLIILDLDMPILNGFETLQLLKQANEYQAIPVLVRSGHEEAGFVNRCYEMGCQGYLIKTHEQYPLIRTLNELTSGFSGLRTGVPRIHAPRGNARPID